MKRYAILFSFSLLAACNRTSAPAPVVHHGALAEPDGMGGGGKAARAKNIHHPVKAKRLKPPQILAVKEKAQPLAAIQPDRSPVKKAAALSEKSQTIKVAQPPAPASSQKPIKDPQDVKPQKAEANEAASSQQASSVEKIAVPSKPAEESSSAFVPPVQGKVISDFGQKENGLQNDGINIAAITGAPIRATQEGQVVFANEKKGFGQLILVKHKGGWVSAYAHLGRMLVKPGQYIKKGQAIGEAGQSGGVDQPQVHFEMRKDTKPVNPLDYVKP